MRKYITLLLIIMVSACAKESTQNIPQINDYLCPASTSYYSDEYGCHKSPIELHKKQFSGKVLDENDNPISDVKITGKSIISLKDNISELQDFLSSNLFTKEDGTYFIEDANVYDRVEITASKDNWRIAKIIYASLINNVLIDNVDFYRFKGKLIYTSIDNNIYKINIIIEGGSEKFTISEDGVNSLKPVCSPDGNKIAYIAQTNRENNLFTVNVDGSDRKKIYNNIKDSWISWSPDSKKIVFESDSSDHKKSQIFTTNSDGTNLVDLTNLSEQNHSPSWSPDVNEIVYVEEKDNKSNVILINQDGTNKTIINSKEGYNNFQSPQWSPDTKKIMYLDSNNKIIIINADGTNEVSISENINSLPKWYPDSQKIILAIRGGDEIVNNYGRKVNSTIYSINSDGKDKTQLENARAFKSSPSFSPDGKKISFVSNLDGENKIYIMNLDEPDNNKYLYGGSFQRITHESTNDDSIVLWSPK